MRFVKADVFPFFSIAALKHLCLENLLSSQLCSHIIVEDTFPFLPIFLCFINRSKKRKESRQINVNVFQFYCIYYFYRPFLVGLRHGTIYCLPLHTFIIYFPIFHFPSSLFFMPLKKGKFPFAFFAVVFCLLLSLESIMELLF